MFYDFLKRTIDILGSIFVLILFFPIMVIVALVIKLISPGPVLYSPKRVGKNGKLFTMLKFRSMYMYKINGKWVHAEKYLETNRKLMAAYKKGSYKLKKDPRITFLGKFLRKFSLDEVPQQKVYPHTSKYVKIILSGRPGVTGPWQVSGRSFINFDKRVVMDAAYVKRRSILYDIWIIIKTPIAMISGIGAV